MSETFVDSYDPATEQPARIPDSYRKSVEVDGELYDVCVVVVPTRSLIEHLTQHQLEVLDTAGADPFTSMNEWYIRVRRNIGAGLCWQVPPISRYADDVSFVPMLS